MECILCWGNKDCRGIGIKGIANILDKGAATILGYRDYKHIGIKGTQKYWDKKDRQYIGKKRNCECIGLKGNANIFG